MNECKDNTEINGNYCPKIKSRWTSYSYYRLVLWAWTMNECTIMFIPTQVSHNGFYAHAIIVTASLVLIGMPLAYSEVCLAQYTNCDAFTLWNFCPLFRNVGYASYYLMFTRTIYLLVLASWYLIYTFHAATDTPPWLNCHDFHDCKCMVKKVNISVFQHCLEAQLLFHTDCGMKTASNCFFEREIGDRCTADDPNCYRPWKHCIAILTICVSVYVLSIKKNKAIQIMGKCLAYYACVAILTLFCVALSSSGTWYATKITFNWSSYSLDSCFNIFARGALSAGTGTYALVLLSRDVPFRSPATMAAISTGLFALFTSTLLALIAFTGIKTMSYYHGEEENIIEVGFIAFFPIFASMSEIMSYFGSFPMSAFAWFSVGFLSLYVNFCISYLFIAEPVLNCCELVKRNKNMFSFLLMCSVTVCTLPFLCSDITQMLTDATEIMLTFNSLLLSVSLYWIYGVRRHTVDIIFMIGIKPSCVCRLAWLLNPMFLAVVLYRSWRIYREYKHEHSYYIKSLNMTCDILVFYLILGVYVFIIFIGILAQIIKYLIARNLRAILSPMKCWGPKDLILYRSRFMFLPAIMTREFLYRQVRMHGSKKRQKNEKSVEIDTRKHDTLGEQLTWNALTSN